MLQFNDILINNTFDFFLKLCMKCCLVFLWHVIYFTVNGFKVNIMTYFYESNQNFQKKMFTVTRVWQFLPNLDIFSLKIFP